MSRANPETTEPTRRRFLKVLLARARARPMRHDRNLKGRDRRFTRGLLNLLVWLMMLVLIQASALDHGSLTVATEGFVSCTDRSPFNSSAAHLSPDQSSAMERSYQQAVCSPFSTVEPLPKNIFQRFLVLLEECCGSCYICRF